MASAMGLKAFIYGQPLLDTQRIFETSTSVNVATEYGYAPVNQFSHFTHLVTTNESVVVAPNDDTLYAVGWLELKHEADGGQRAQRRTASTSSRWSRRGRKTSPTSEPRPPGCSLRATTWWRVPGTDEGMEEVEGLKVIHSPYDRVWLIGRVVDRRPDDTEALPIEEQMKIVPLKNWLKEGLNYKAEAAAQGNHRSDGRPHPGHRRTRKPAALLEGAGEGAEEVRRRRKRTRRSSKNSPPSTSGPAKSPARATTARASMAGLEEAVEAGPTVVLADVKEAYHAGVCQAQRLARRGRRQIRHQLPVAGRGRQARRRRPLAQRVDLSARAHRRHDGETERASKRYVVHFPASDFPFPVKAFWSLTMYEASGFFVSNPLERFALGNRSTVHYNEDGSLNMYLQTAEPSNEQQKENWLPTPAGEFHVVLRLYATEPQDIEPILEGTGSLADAADRTLPRKRVHGGRAGMSELTRPTR